MEQNKFAWLSSTIRTSVKILALICLALTLLLPACQPAFRAPAGATGYPAASEPPQAAGPPTSTIPLPQAAATVQIQPPMPTAKAETPVEMPGPPEDRTKYTLEARLDYATHRLAVVEGFEYTNTTSEQLPALVLVIEALRYPGGFQLGRVFDAAGSRVTNYRYEDLTLVLPLPAPLEPGEAAAFRIEYTLQLLDVSGLAQNRPHPLGYSELQANFGDWYPYVPPYKPGQGWLAHSPASFGEHLVYDPADFEVTLRLEGAQSGLVIAASALPVETGEGMRRYRHEAARSFAWSASPYYETLTQTVVLEDGREVTAASYFFAYHREAGASLLQTVAESLALYSRLFGPYPHEALAAVQAEFMDGMEYDGLFFLSTDFFNWHKDTPEDFLTALGAHETSHMWWLGLVGSDQALEPWLDESLATYSERLFYENLHPEALEWWWAWRVNYYEPSGPIDIQIYDPPAAADQWRRYRDPVYLRGALFLEELRNWMGDEAFFAGLREYVRRYAYRQAEGTGFLEVMREVSPEDPTSIFEKYLARTR